MKKLYLYITLILTAIVFYSCEQPVEQADIPYIPKLVVKGIIKEGLGVNNIYIGRTLPVSVKFSSDFANLSDAAAVIINRDLIYPLKHYGNGLYKNDTLQIIRGEKYYFIANWQNLSANAETVVPKLGSIYDIQLKTENVSGKKITHVNADIRPFSDEVYGCTWAILQFNGTINTEADSFAHIASEPENGVLHLHTTDIPQTYLSGNPPLGLKIYYYDKAFADFFATQGSNKVADAIFGQTGSKVKWNINGDGIGMFISRQDTLIQFR